MSENLKKFLEEASKNEELKAKLTALTDKENAVEKVVEIAKEYGLSLNAEDFKPVDGEELSLDQLDQVAGGASSNKFICPYCGMEFDKFGNILSEMERTWHMAQHYLEENIPK